MNRSKTRVKSHFEASVVRPKMYIELKEPPLRWQDVVVFLAWTIFTFGSIALVAGPAMAIALFLFFIFLMMVLV